MDDPTACCPGGGYCDPCDLIVGVNGLHVTAVERDECGRLVVTVESEAAVMGCPACGVVVRGHGRDEVTLVDAPSFGAPVRIRWRKRRLACLEPLCAAGSFTQQSAAIPARARLTTRLREAIATAVEGGNRAVEEVARAHGVSWPTARRALVAAAARWLPVPEPVRVLGVDETRARSVRWVLPTPAGSGPTLG